MSSIPTTLRELYPDAPADAELSVHRPTNVGIPARTFAKPIYAIATVTGITAVLLSLGPDDWMVTNLLPPALETLVWTTIAGVLAACFVAYVLLRFLVRGVRFSRRTSWDRFARERGLRDATGMRLPLTKVPVLRDGHSRTFPRLYTGRIAGCDVVLGTTVWHEDHGRDETVHRAGFVVTTLPGGYGSRYPATSVTRFFHGTLDLDIDLFDEDEELRFESIRADINCNIEVSGASRNDVRWRELFDPILIDALAEHVDGQWTQVERDLVASFGGRVGGRARARDLDTACLAVAVARAAFDRAMVGDTGRRRAA